jgi:hypothetical protein
MIALLNFIRIYELIQKLIRGQTHRQESDLISVHLSFRKESELRNVSIEIQRMLNMKCFVISVIIVATGIVSK